MSKKLKHIILPVLLILLVAAAIFAYLRFAPTPQAGDKTVYFEVIHSDTSRKEFTLSTDAQTLREALEQEGLIEGSDSEFGMFVTTVDGETADDSQRQWWRFDKDGEMLPTGVDDTMISDGEHYEAVLDVY